MFIHHLSDVQSDSIGEGTHIWQFSVICAGAKIGRNCNIGSNCFIENDVIIGDRVTIKNGTCVFNNITLMNDVFIGPNVTFTNDPLPKSRRDKDRNLKSYPATIVGEGASIGGGATILPGIIIGKNAMIGAGAIVTKDVNEFEIVYGEQAKKRKKMVV